MKKHNVPESYNQLAGRLSEHVLALKTCAKRRKFIDKLSNM